MIVRAWWRARRRGWIAAVPAGASVRDAARRSSLVVRHHFMLGATAVALSVAAMGSLGYFDEPPAPGPSTSAKARESTAFGPAIGRTPVATRPFEITIFLVTTREQQAAVYAAENTYRSPYLPGGRSAEVLLVRTVEDELMAAHRFEEVRATFPGANVVVTDLR